MGEKIVLFISAVETINKTLNLWETGKHPTDAEVKELWAHFKELLEVAQKEQIDTDIIVCQHAEAITIRFLSYAPVTAFAA